MSTTSTTLTAANYNGQQSFLLLDGSVQVEQADL
jgi:hypothetical protein